MDAEELTPSVVAELPMVRVAIPEALVVAAPPTIEPAPLATAKVTETPGTGLLLNSLTITYGALATAVLTVAVWVFPALLAS